jgi:hypothetical protein
MITDRLVNFFEKRGTIWFKFQFLFSEYNSVGHRHPRLSPYRYFRRDPQQDTNGVARHLRRGTGNAACRPGVVGPIPEPITKTWPNPSNLNVRRRKSLFVSLPTLAHASVSARAGGRGADRGGARTPPTGSIVRRSLRPGRLGGKFPSYLSHDAISNALIENSMAFFSCVMAFMCLSAYRKVLQMFYSSSVCLDIVGH